MAQYLGKAKTLLQGITFTITKVTRQENALADQLAKHASGFALGIPPGGFVHVKTEPAVSQPPTPKAFQTYFAIKSPKLVITCQIMLNIKTNLV